MLNFYFLENILAQSVAQSLSQALAHAFLVQITALKWRSFCRSPAPRNRVALALSTSPENAFFNLRMKKQDRTIMVAGAQHCAQKNSRLCC